MAVLDRSIRACEKCQMDDGQSPPRLNADGNLVFLCSHAHGGDGPFEFIRITPPDELPPARKAASTKPKPAKGITDDLLEPLRHCIFREDGWTEYGVVEHRLHKLAPELFARHVADRGHHMFGEKPLTASRVRFSKALERLEDEGLLRHKVADSTGAAWSHSPKVSYWMIAIGADARKTTKWAQFCKETGRSDDWTDEDRAGLTSPTQGVV
jgi:hypothetical protein